MHIIKKFLLNDTDKSFYNRFSKLVTNKSTKYYINNLPIYKLYEIVAECNRKATDYYMFVDFYVLVSSFKLKDEITAEYLSYYFDTYKNILKFNSLFGFEMSEHNLYYKLEFFRENMETMYRFADYIKNDNGSFYYNNFDLYSKYETYCKGTVDANEFDLYMKFNALMKSSKMVMIGADHNDVDKKFASYCELIKFSAAVGIDLSDIQIYNRIDEFSKSMADMDEMLDGQVVNKADLYKEARAQIKNAKYVSELLGRDEIDENSIDSYIKLLKYLPNYVKWRRFVAMNDFVFGISDYAVRYNKNKEGDALRLDYNVIDNWIANDVDVLDRTFFDIFSNNTIQARRFIQESLVRNYPTSLAFGRNVKFYYTWVKNDKYCFISIFLVYDDLFETDAEDFGDVKLVID